MWIRVRERPTGRRLFHVCAAASGIAVLAGGLFFLACWAATGYDPEAGRDFGKAEACLAAVLVTGVLVHYPWGPCWVRANGCRPDDP